MALHVVDFKTLTGDTGYKDNASIQPITNGEPAKQDTLGRPDETIRVRSDVLRELLTEQKQLNDLDRALLLIGGGALTFTGSAVVDTGTITAASSMYLMAMATPGGGGAPTFLDSSKSTLSMGTPSNNEIVLTSVQDAYQGAGVNPSRVNLISAEIIDGGVAAPLTVTVEGAPLAHIKVQIEAGVHTVSAVLSAINGDPTASTLVLATLGAGSVSGNNAPVFSLAQWGSDLTARYLRGGAAGIVHEITSGGLATFFGTSANRLQKGDTLAIEYNNILSATSTGGRLQSTPENANINVDGALFNTRRNPSKIPNCIPIAKCISDTTVLFINGAYIVKNVGGTFLVDSYNGANAAIDASGFVRLDAAPVPNIPPVNIQDTFENADTLFDTIMTEIAAARSSVGFGAFATLDQRLEAAEAETLNARNSTAYATVYGSLDARLEFAETDVLATKSEVTTARTSSTLTGSPFGSLDARLEAHEALTDGAGDTDALNSPTFAGYTGLGDQLDRHADHSRVFVSCSDGAGINAMFSNLKLAVDYLNTTLNGGTIHCIDNVGHTVTSSAGTQFPVIVKPIRIIGQDRITITNDRTGTTAVLEFSTGSEGSELQMLSIVNGGSPSSRALNVNASRVAVRDCIIAQETYVGASGTPNDCIFDRSTFTTTGAGQRAFNVNAGLRHRVTNCVTSGDGSGGIGFAVTVSTVSVLAESCTFSRGGTVASALNVSAGDVTIRNCHSSIGALASIAGGNVAPILIGGPQVKVDGLDVALSGSGQVLGQIIGITNFAVAKNIRVDGNARVLNYVTTPTESPVQVLSSAHVDGLTVQNFVIPNTTDNPSFTLSVNEPIVRIEGTDATLGEAPTILENLLMRTFAVGATVSATQTFAFVGPRGVSGNSQAATAAQNLRLHRARIILTHTALTVTLDNTSRLIFANFANDSEITECDVITSTNHRGPIIRIHGASVARWKFERNRIHCAGVGRTDAILLYFTGSHANIRICHNTIVCIGGTVAPKVIELNLPTGFSLNDNTIERTGFAAGAGDELINIDTPTNGTVISNTLLHDGNATTPIDYDNAVTNTLPTEVNMATLNVI